MSDFTTAIAQRAKQSVGTTNAVMLALASTAFEFLRTDRPFELDGIGNFATEHGGNPLEPAGRRVVFTPNDMLVQQLQALTEEQRAVQEALEVLEHAGLSELVQQARASMPPTIGMPVPPVEAKGQGTARRSEETVPAERGATAKAPTKKAATRRVAKRMPVTRTGAVAHTARSISVPSLPVQTAQAEETIRRMPRPATKRAARRMFVR